MNRNPKTSLSEIISNEIANQHNQHVIMLVEGKTGAGKSNFCLTLAYAVSKRFADKLGGKPEDYFTIENVAMLTTKELIRVVRGIKKHGIYIMDDIGGEAFNSRNWNSKGNKIFGYILQTFRTYNNLLIMSAPDREFVDKIGRNILHYKVVMHQDLKLKDYGITVGTVSRVEKMYHKDGGGNMYPFITRDREVFTSMIVKRAPQHLIDDYEKLRESIQAESQERKSRAFEELINMDEFEGDDDLEYKIVKIKEENPTLTQTQIAKIAKTSQSKVSRALSNTHMDSSSFVSDIPMSEYPQ